VSQNIAEKTASAMSDEERTKFIFNLSTSSSPPTVDVSRIEFLENIILGGMRCVRDGVEFYCANEDKYPDEKTRSGGILALAEVVAIGLEAVSASFSGKTKENSGGSYNATKNVSEFVIRYFPRSYHAFPNILWDSMRNGLIHTGLPKHYSMGDRHIFVSFFLSKSSWGRSTIIKKEQNLYIYINSIELANVFERAVVQYIEDVFGDKGLQNNFINAWQSRETGRTITNSPPYNKEFSSIITICDQGPVQL